MEPVYAESVMAKREHDRFANLAADIGSPRVLPAIDKALVENQRERSELLELRKMAVRRHGESAPASTQMPVQPPAAAQQSVEASSGPSNFDGRLGSLIDLYCVNNAFLELRYKTRKHYETLIKFLRDQLGENKISDWKLENVMQLYEGWVRDRTESMGRSLIVMFRILIYFGADVLHDSECERLGGVLHRMRFPVLKPRGERISAAQATAVRKTARKMNRASIALAQAFQFDCNLRQTDVTGEWVPATEPEDSDVHDVGNKWLRGLRWEEIDQNLFLTHTTSRDQKQLVVDLHLAPMVREELELKYGSFARDKMPARGPIIVSEASDLPWYAVEFRRNWRLAADKAGVPRTVKNRNSRANSKPERAESDDVDLSLELGERPSLTH